MKVIKKSNNNVAEYENSKGRRSIAFGNGIGFKAVPYELTDLSNINMTFYKLENHYERLIMEIPEEILSVSSDIVMYSQKNCRDNWMQHWFLAWGIIYTLRFRNTQNAWIFTAIHL